MVAESQNGLQEFTEQIQTEENIKSRLYYMARRVMRKLGLRSYVHKVIGEQRLHRLYAFMIGEQLPGIYARREFLAKMYLQGSGIEIGALHRPLRVPKHVRVTYVDRMRPSELTQHYSELGSEKLMNADVLDDGETLASIRDGSQQFVIANHFIEHCQDPILAIKNMLRVLAPDGVLYLTVPDKRYSPDYDRPVTTIEHLLRDHHEGPAWSKRQHFEEWVRLWLYERPEGEEAFERRVQHLIDTNYSIHYHVWTHTEFLRFLLAARDELNSNFEIEMFFKNESETTAILRKPVHG